MNRKSTIIAIAVTATLFVTGTALAQLSTPEGTRTPFGNDGRAPSSFRPNSVDPQANNSCNVRSGVQRQRTVAMSSTDGAIDLLAPTNPQDLMVMFSNAGNEEVEFEITYEDRQIDYIRVLPGRRYNGLFASVTDVSATCISSIGMTCAVDTDMIAVPSDPNYPGLDVHNWLAIPGFHGDVVDEPDQLIDCLWEWDTLWSSNTPRNIDLFIELTSNQDLDIEIIDKNDTVMYQTTLCAGCLPQFQFTQGVWEDAKEVRFRGAKSVTAPACTASEFRYDLVFLP